MSKLPSVTAKQVQRVLLKLGYQNESSQGGHLQYRHPERQGKVTVSSHGSKIIPKGTLKSIFKQSGLTIDEFNDLL